MPNSDQLLAIMPRVPVAKRSEYLPFLQAAMVEFSIESAARQAAFLAQVAHESGQLRFMEEIWGPTDAQRRYEPVTTLATKLGNTEVGDGKRFKGRGPIQITGRANYQRFGSLLGADLASNPGLAALPDLAFRIAGLFWMKNGLNELADRADAESFRQITRRINGGLNGLAERERFYAVACDVLGVDDAPVASGARRGRRAPDMPASPTFARGHEAIRAFLRTRRVRAKAPAGKPRSRQSTRASTKTARPKARRRKR